MRVLTVVGARPQFIKAAAVSRLLILRHEEILVHTGQHYDPEMSDVFFSELPLPEPNHNLGVGSGSHARQTAEVMLRLEPVIEEVRPDMMLVYGDTNSTVAAALTGVKLNVPIAHVEAGVRRFRLDVPEEVNRVVTDHISTLLFCPTLSAIPLLEAEGLGDRATFTGDVMLDILLQTIPRAKAASRAAEQFGVAGLPYILATIHRPRNADDPARLATILEALETADMPVILPLHPRSLATATKHGLLTRGAGSRLRIVSPAGYLDMIALEAGADKIVTDSGGVQREAFNLGIPCITLDERTEWTETIEDGWNVLVDADRDRIATAVRDFKPAGPRRPHFGKGDAAERIVAEIDRAG
ncbi:MAG TPA: UDP-N-acetylglucosamine 2-epimerase (non-hydrolyzing) [Chloroflexota bacterium]|nr:UDP-N-acetylglucosamine 2-epimerase (non-hydrolyzing) [Chloroflexota bacterium]